MIHIHRPKVVKKKHKIIHCKKCKCRRKHIVQFYEYYDPLLICLKCEKETAVEYNKAAIKHFGEFASLNKVILC